MSAPPVLAPDTLRIIPLGGLGDIGRNMTCFEVNGKMLLVDCGVLFPNQEHPGADLLLPALGYVEDRLDDVVGLVITHGHEDHVGAVPHLLRMRQDIPVYGSQLTLALLREKLKEYRFHQTDLRQVTEGDVEELGPFACEFLAVNHSIPDALAVFLRTSGGTVLHTGDFKMDQIPLDGRITDLRGFARMGEEGVDLFMVDSTNAETPGFTLPEVDVEPAIERVFSSTQGKLIVACFSSHVHRVQQVMNEARKNGRKVAYIGRSMIRNMTVAQSLGYLKVPGNTLIESRDLENYRDDEVVIVCTGSQGEPLAALSRMAHNDHPSITLTPEDTVLLASSLVPGNENAVGNIINGITKLGSRVIHKGNALVHVSGHACAGELLYAYNIVQPKNVMPIHGEMRHLTANARLAQKTGVKNTIIVEDGAVVDLREGVAKVVGQVDAPYIFVDGSTVGDLGDVEFSDRRILGEEGFISIIAVVDVRAQKVLNGPDLHARGFVDDESVFDEIRGPIVEALESALKEGTSDAYTLQQLIRRIVGRWVNRSFKRRPMIVPVVITN